MIYLNRHVHLELLTTDSFSDIAAQEDFDYHICQRDVLLFGVSAVGIMYAWQFEPAMLTRCVCYLMLIVFL